MSRRTPGAGVPVAVAGAVATWLCLWSWAGFVVDRSEYLLPSALGIALVTAVGSLARGARLPLPVVVAAQLLVAMLFLNAVWGSSLLPTPDSVRAAVEQVQAAVASAREYPAPVPAEAPSIAPILVLGGLACHLLVDLVAVTLGRAPVAGLPLLTIYSLPVSVLDRAVGWQVFVLGAAAFLVMLAVQERSRLVRWGRPLAADDPVPVHHRSSGLLMGSTAIIAAVLVPVVVPTPDPDTLAGLGGGAGTGGDRQVRITNPMTDLRRDLVLQSDRSLMRVSTTNPMPAYVRLAVLTTFTGEAWTPGDRSLPDENAAVGRVPSPIGLDSDVPRTEHRWRLSIGRSLDSRWLPTPRYVSSVEAGEQWIFDSSVLDFHVNDNQESTAGLEYALTELDLDLSAAELASAPPPPDSMVSTYSRLPDMPAEIEELAAAVTEGATSDFARAHALQEFFQDHFEYSTAQVPGNGTNDLLRFLLSDRSGYCEQFASAMAVMARILDMPARVSVGFLRPDQMPDGTWEFSAQDMHAWPEIYLEGYGWVMFEPTPTDHTVSVPDYTRGLARPDRPDAPDLGPTPSAAPTAQPTLPTDRPADRTPEQAGSDGADEEAGFPWAPVAWVAGGLLVLAGLALVPRLLRSRRSDRRWHSGADPAEAAWAELRDRAVDLGVPWPRGRSPRRTAATLLPHLAPPIGPDSVERPGRGRDAAPEAAEALDRLALAVELARYAPPGMAVTDEAQARGWVDLVGASLEAGVAPTQRRRARWWPKSVLTREPRPGRKPVEAPRADSQDELVDSLD